MNLAKGKQSMAEPDLHPHLFSVKADAKYLRSVGLKAPSPLRTSEFTSGTWRGWSPPSHGPACPSMCFLGHTW